MYVPSAALDVTVKDQDGKTLITKTYEYNLYDLYVKALDPKPEEVMLPIWRYDRQLHIENGIEPLHTDSNTFVLPLNENTKSVEIRAQYRFIHEPGKEDVWNTATKTITFGE